MKVRLAILDENSAYLTRFASTFSTKYAEDIQVYSFNDYQTAVDSLQSIHAHVFLVSTAFTIDPALSRSCAVAYFVDTAGIASYEGFPAICKYQKLDLIYRQILNLYAETGSFELNAGGDGSQCRLTLYMSPAGGVGTSSVAAANAQYYTSLGRSTLFLCLNPYDSVKNYFQASGSFNFRDVIRSVKGKRKSLALRLKSYVEQDESGVYFFADTPLALDVLELSAADCQTLLQELMRCGEYDEIVADVPFDLHTDILKLAASIVIVANGEETVNQKIVRAYQAVDALEKNGASPFIGNVYLVYNGFSERNGTIAEGVDWTILGTTQKYSGLTWKHLASMLIQTGVFDKIR